MMTIFLVGFMGCGKSTLGKKLANNLDFNFIDLDDFIEDCEARTIKEIFEINGEGYFRKLERFYLLKLIKIKILLLQSEEEHHVFLIILVR